MYNNSEKTVWVVGHKNPDTDSICAAIAYAELKNKIEDRHYEPKRAGQINEETRYVLNRFGVEEPAQIHDVGAQAKDIAYRKTAAVSSNISLKKAWEIMRTQNVVTLPVTNSYHRLEGLIVTGDIAKSYMDAYDNGILAKARTQYKNIIETLNGTLIAGNEHGYFVKGKVVIATGDSDSLSKKMESDDLVILGNRKEIQLTAIEKNASCIIVCAGVEVDEEIILKANKRDCVIISTPYDTYTVARLINQSMPIKYFMKKEKLITFDEDDYADDMKNVMSTVRHRDFPILDEDGKYMGMVSRRNLLNMQKKQVILVDHNEKSQAVDGIEEAEILEIIDHHRLGSLETMSPVYFRNQPLGCTSTIIYEMYRENNVEVDKKIAGLMCSAIISDTLMFRSPTCTVYDKNAAKQLAEIAEIELTELAGNMFEAGSDFTHKTTEEICYQDFKTFSAGEHTFGVGQISAVSSIALNSVKGRISEYLDTILKEKNLDMVFMMLTDILEESTEVICCGEGAKDLIKMAFNVYEVDGGFNLDGVVSRKKQLIPVLIGTLQQ